MIELGAGCGLVGIAASEAGAAEVLLTDHAAVVPLLEHNISLNEAKGGNPRMGQRGSLQGQAV